MSETRQPVNYNQQPVSPERRVWANPDDPRQVFEVPSYTATPEVETGTDSPEVHQAIAERLAEQHQERADEVAQTPESHATNEELARAIGTYAKRCEAVRGWVENRGFDVDLAAMQQQPSKLEDLKGDYELTA